MKGPSSVEGFREKERGRAGTLSPTWMCEQMRLKVRDE